MSHKRGKRKPYIRKTDRVYKPFGKLEGKEGELLAAWVELRSYAKVADKFGVSEQAVYLHAKKHDWTAKLVEIVTQTQEKVMGELVSKMTRDASQLYNMLSLAEINAGNFLKAPDLKAGGHAAMSNVVRAAMVLDMVIKNKRLLTGNSTENKQLTLKDFMMEAHKAAGFL